MNRRFWVTLGFLVFLSFSTAAVSQARADDGDSGWGWGYDHNGNYVYCYGYYADGALYCYDN